MHSHHRIAVLTIAAAAVLDAGLGLAFAAADHVSAADGLYWSVTTATTVGYGDIAPHGWGAHLLAVVVMLTCIPLVAATFSLFTSGLAAGHVNGAEERIKEHVNGALRHHLGPMRPGPVTGIPDIPQRYEQDVPLDRLVPHPANPNEADLGLLSELVEANGFAGAVLAQESTGILIDGEHRWRTALEKGMTGLPVLWLDVDDDARDRLLASLNESTRRGRNDEAKLVALLTGLAQQPRGLEGTGFDGDDLDALISALGQPGFKPEDGDPPRLDELEPRFCPKCGYDTANDPEALKVRPG